MRRPLHVCLPLTEVPADTTQTIETNPTDAKPSNPTDADSLLAAMRSGPGIFSRTNGETIQKNPDRIAASLIADLEEGDCGEIKNTIAAQKSLIEIVSLFASVNRQDAFIQKSKGTIGPVDVRDSEHKNRQINDEAANGESVSPVTIPMSDEVVRNALLLSAVLPNLVAIRPQADTVGGERQPETGDGVNNFLLSVVSTAQSSGNSSGILTSCRASMKGDTEVRLTEDYVLLDEGLTNDEESLQDESAFSAESIRARIKLESESEAESNMDREGHIHQPLFTATSSNSAKSGAVQSVGRQMGTDGLVAYGIEGSQDSPEVSEKSVASVPEEVMNMNDSLPGKKAVFEESDGRADTYENMDEYELMSRIDAVKAHIRHGKETPSVSDKGSLVSTMTQKIEEIVGKYASRPQIADMTIRLRINERESLLIGLKEQGERVVIDVKSSSESLMNLLQSNKDIIARELENKQIFATINVDPEGEGQEQRKQQRDRRRRNAEEEKRAFMGILDALG